MPFNAVNTRVPPGSLRMRDSPRNSSRARAVCRVFPWWAHSIMRVGGPRNFSVGERQQAWNSRRPISRVCLVVGLQSPREIVLSARHHRTFRSGEVTIQRNTLPQQIFAPEILYCVSHEESWQISLRFPYPRIPVLHSLYKISVVFST